MVPSIFTAHVVNQQGVGHKPWGLSHNTLGHGMVPKIFWSVLYDGRGRDRIKEGLFRWATHYYSIKIGVNFPEWPWSWWVTGAVKKSLTLRPKEISAMVQILWTMVVDRHTQPLQGKNRFFPLLGEVFPLTEGLLMGDPFPFTKPTSVPQSSIFEKRKA